MARFGYTIHGQDYEIEAATQEEADAKATAFGEANPPPKTTLGGSLRSLATGAAKGALALPSIADIGPQWRREDTGEPIDVPGSFSRVAPPIAEAARSGMELAEETLGGPGVGDTGFERGLGVLGEYGAAVATPGGIAGLVTKKGLPQATRIAGALTRGGPAGAARAATRVARQDVAPEVARIAGRYGAPTAGAAAAAHTARELGLPWWAEIPMAVAGGYAGTVPGTLTRGVRSITGRPAVREASPVTQGVLARRAQHQSNLRDAKTQYRRAERLADDAGLVLDTGRLKEQVYELLDSVTPAQLKGLNPTIQRILKLPENVSVREFRKWQRTINEVYSRQAAGKKGPTFVTRNMNRIMNQSLDEAIDNAAVRSDAPGFNALSAVKDANRNWRNVHTAEARDQLWQRAAERMVTKSGAPDPDAFEKWLRQPRNLRQVEDLYGPRHAENLLRVNRNLARIPDAEMDALLGPMTAEREHIVEGLRTAGHLATMPIGSLRYKGRRLYETIAEMYGRYSQGRQMMMLVQAMDDPSFAAHLARRVGVDPTDIMSVPPPTPPPTPAPYAPFTARGPYALPGFTRE